MLFLSGNSAKPFRVQGAYIADKEVKKVTDYWRTIAEGTPGENGRGGYMRTAMTIDSQGQPTNAIQDFSLIDVRY